MNNILANIMNSTSQNHNIDNQRDSLQIIIPVTILYTLIFITGIVGNISTCIVIKKNRSMQTATNYYLSSLAISDLLLLVVGVPHEIFFIWSKYSYMFGEVFCVGRGLLAETSANATVLTITAFTVERYLAICYPLGSQAISKLNRASRVIVMIWICSTITAIPQAASFGISTHFGVEKCTVVREIIKYSFQLSTIIFFFVPMLIIFVLYMLIGLKLYRSKMIKSNSDNISAYCGSYSTYLNVRKYDATHNFPNDSNSSNVRGGITQFGTRRVVRMLAAVVICFFICWAPFHAQRLIAVYGTGEALKHHKIIYTIATYISGVLYYLSTCINPIIYNLMSKKFRKAFKDVLFLKKSNSITINSTSWNLRKDGHTFRKKTLNESVRKTFV